MSSLTAISSAPSATITQSKIAQARQAADQAEAYARDLRVQANDAQREAQRTRSKSDDLSAQQSQVKTLSIAPTPASRVKPVPVINPLGQTTGRIINTTA